MSRRLTTSHQISVVIALLSGIAVLLVALVVVVAWNGTQAHDDEQSHGARLAATATVHGEAACISYAKDVLDLASRGMSVDRIEAVIDGAVNHRFGQRSILIRECGTVQQVIDDAK